MKFIIVFLLISSICFGQKNKPVQSTPVLTKLDTAKAVVFNDSLMTDKVIYEFKSFVLREIKEPYQYDFLKSILDKFTEEKKKLWADYINKNK